MLYPFLRRLSSHRATEKLQISRPIISLPNTNIQAPKEITVVNGGAGAVMPILTHLINNTDKSRNPHKLNLIITDSHIGREPEKSDNPLLRQKFGQSCAHIVCGATLQRMFNLLETDRPSMLEKDIAGAKNIEELIAILKQKHPEIQIQLHHILPHEALYHSSDKQQKDIYIGSPSQGIRVVIGYSDAYPKGQSVIIDASRVYGKFVNGEIPVFSPEIAEAIRYKTSGIVDLYSLTTQQLLSRLSSSCEDGKTVPIIGAGLTTLWLLPVIIKEGFHPLIINTDSKDVDYIKLMVHANTWIKDALCKVLDYSETELQAYLQSCTIKAANIRHHDSIEHHGKKIQINQFFDCTGYCLNKGYINGLPPEMVINPYLPQQISFDYLSTVREHTLDALNACNQGIARSILAHSFDCREATPSDLYHIFTKRLPQIDRAIKIIEEREPTPLLSPVLRKAMQIQKVLGILNRMAYNDDIIYNKNYQDDEGIHERALAALKQNQHLMLELRRELSHDDVAELLDKIKVEVDMNNPDGRYYNLYGHTPMGSAIMLSMLTKHFLGEEVGLNLFYGMTADPAIKTLAQSLLELPGLQDQSLHNMHDLLRKSIRQLMAEPDLFDYTHQSITFRKSPSETYEHLFQILINQASPSQRSFIQNEKDNIIQKIHDCHALRIPEQFSQKKRCP